MLKSVATRFLKAFISGAAAVAVLSTVVNIHNWVDLSSALSTIGLALVVGGINGLLMGAEKAINWQDTPPVATPQG